MLAGAVLYAGIDPDSGLRTWWRLRTELAESRARAAVTSSEIERLKADAAELHGDPFAGVPPRPLQCAGQGGLVAGEDDVKPRVRFQGGQSGGYGYVKALVAAVGTYVGSAIRNAHLFEQRTVAEEEIVRSRDYLNTITDAIHDGIIVIEEDYTINWIEEVEVDAGGAEPEVITEAKTEEAEAESS